LGQPHHHHGPIICKIQRERLATAELVDDDDLHVRQNSILIWDSSSKWRASPSSAHSAGVSEPDCALTLQLSDEADYPQPMSDSSEDVVWLAAGPVNTRCAGQRRAER